MACKECKNQKTLISPKKIQTYWILGSAYVLGSVVYTTYQLLNFLIELF